MQDDKNTIVQMRFPQKLWYLLKLRTGAILWGGTGRTILLNYKILYNYLQCGHSIFKTTHIASFIRQLNLYGFRKVTSHLQDPLCNSSNPFMHEYMHEYFQFGRPELLNKITRKALTFKKNFKAKDMSKYPQLSFMTPLEKARRALHIALKKTAANLYIRDSANQLFNIQLECEVEENFYDDEESEEYNWNIENSMKIESKIDHPEPECPAPDITNNNTEAAMETDEQLTNHGLPTYDIETQQKNDTENYAMPFLSMPDLDPVPVGNGSQGMELLNYFEQNQDNELEHHNPENKENYMNTLNCVLPSISNDQNDDVSMIEKENVPDHYHGEWDQVFHDLMTSKNTTQECSSEFKDLYSQISKTIDLLNS